MSRYEWMNSCVVDAIRLGIYIPDFPKYIRYNEYLFFLQTNDKTTAITLAAERTNCSELSIYRAIAFFQDGEKIFYSKSVNFE